MTAVFQKTRNNSTNLECLQHEGHSLEFCRTHRKTDLMIRGPLQIPKSSEKQDGTTVKSMDWEIRLPESESQLLHLLALCTSDSPLSFALVFLSVK